MNFISTTCPHCKKELQIPDSEEKLVCMYCAQLIDVPSLLAKTDEPTGKHYARLMSEAESLLSDDLFQCRINLRNLNKNSYAKEFEIYKNLFSPALKAYCLAATENDEAADHFSGILFGRFLKQFEAKGITKESDVRFFDCRYSIVAYTIPAILEQKMPSANALADCFLAKWNSHYPQNPLGKATFESIESGFRKKLCFITTAVCDSLQKDDNCRELTALREFRDGWLAKTPEGRAKIQEYYLFAPIIVQAIERAENKQDVYKDILKYHISPCLNAIEKKQYKKCAEQYEEMILKLERDWLA
jgi:hypothetical protein